MGSFASGYERGARIVLMVFVVHVAFVVHTLLGAVVVGFFPSIAATYATFRRWVLDADRAWTVRQTWSAFHIAWREDLLGANAFGWPQSAVGALLMWEYFLVGSNDMGVLGVAASGVLLFANVAFVVFAAVSWAVRAHFAERWQWAVRMAIWMLLARPFCSVMVLGAVAVVAGAWYIWPGVLMVFGISPLIFGVVIAVASFGRLPGLSLRRNANPTPADVAA